MRAHQLNGQGLIVRTVEVPSLSFMPDLVDAAVGGGVGDTVRDGALIRATPVTPPLPFDEERAAYLDVVREQRERALVRLAGYGTQLLLAEPPEQPEEKELCQTIMQGLLDITTIEGVKAATTVEEVKAAVKAEYARLVGLASEPLKKAFRKVDL